MVGVMGGVLVGGVMGGVMVGGVMVGGMIVGPTLLSSPLQPLMERKMQRMREKNDMYRSPSGRSSFSLQGIWKCTHNHSCHDISHHSNYKANFVIKSH